MLNSLLGGGFSIGVAIRIFVASTELEPPDPGDCDGSKRGEAFTLQTISIGRFSTDLLFFFAVGLFGNHDSLHGGTYYLYLADFTALNMFIWVN